MDEVESLSSILGSAKGEAAPVREAAPASPAAAAEPEKTEPKAEAETKARARDESGKFAKTEEPKEPAKEPAKEPEADGRTVALRAERERRRALEARLKELESQKPPEKVSIFENEDEGIAQRLAEHSRPLREANFNMSVKLARLSYKDEYEKAEVAFFDSAEADPRLYEQLRTAADPGEFIFTIGTQIAELGPVGGNFMKYREKVTTELKGELSKRDEQIKALTDKIASLEKSQQALETIPRSLNKGNEGAPRSIAEADEDDLKSIVRYKPHHS